MDKVSDFPNTAKNLGDMDIENAQTYCKPGQSELGARLAKVN